MISDRITGSSSSPYSGPNTTTPLIIVKKARFDGTGTVASISTARNVVSADVVSERPIFDTAAAARSPPERPAPSVSTNACVTCAVKSTAIPTLITMHVLVMAFRFSPVIGIHARIDTSVSSTTHTAINAGPSGSITASTIITASADVNRFSTVSLKVMPTIS